MNIDDLWLTPLEPLGQFNQGWHKLSMGEEDSSLYKQRTLHFSKREDVMKFICLSFNRRNGVITNHSFVNLAFWWELFPRWLMRCVSLFFRNISRKQSFNRIIFTIIWIRYYSHLYFSQIITSVMACNLKIMKLFRSPFVVTIHFVIVQCDMSIDVLFQNKIARQGK